MERDFVFKPTKEHIVRLKIHHGGMFIYKPSTVYVNGHIVEEEWGWDVDTMSYIDLTKVIKSIGYKAFKCLWYKHPQKALCRRLKPLNDVARFDVVEVYMEDGVIERCDKKLNDVKGDEVVVIDGAEVEPVVVGEVQVEAEVHVEGEVQVEGEVNVEEAKVQVEGQADVEPQVQLDEEGLVEVEVQVEDEAGGVGEMEVVVQCMDDIDVGVDKYDDDVESKESDEDYVGDKEDDDDSSDCSEVSDSDFEENSDWTAWLESATFSQSTEATFDTNKVDSRNSNLADDDLADEVEYSDELDTPPGSEDEGPPKVRYPRFKVPENDEDVKFEVGLQFNSKKQILEVVKTFAVISKKNLKIKKNDKRRVILISKQKGCPFYLRVRKSMQATYWQVVTFKDEHCCFGTATNSQDTPKWASKMLMSLLMHSPDMRLKAIVAYALEKWGFRMSMDQAYRAKVKAMEKIEGATKDQYKHLRSYVAELIEKNKNSTVKIKCDLTPHGPVFERMYVCLEACKNAFVTTCRPLIGLDGCFLKGEFGGQLLSEVGKDGNNQMFPFAYGLVEVIKELGENVEHRLCIKHLYGNWKKKYPGAHMKELMRMIKTYDVEAWKDLERLNPASWTKSSFKVNTKCDLQVNNMCEAFNNVIMEYRDKPIITLLEGIRFYISSRIVKLRTILIRYEGSIYPKVQQIIEKNKKACEAWRAHWCGDVDLSLFETYYRKWELTRIPCTHSIPCMWINSVEPELSVNSYYRKSTVLTTYSFIVYPCNGPNLWPPLQTPVMLPPIMRRAHRRPKKARNKKNDESTKRSNLAKQSRLVVCKNCRTIGHDRRTCKGKTAANRTIPKGGNKNLKRQSPCLTPVAAKKQKNDPSSSQTTSAGHQGGLIGGVALPITLAHPCFMWIQIKKP
ncbi:hypothetical protein GmHk_09G025420 [Glycine max]|nr:hypothetical protein GmHk_09G025420 [Glycine max]